MDTKISVFGAFGFVLGEFCRQFPREVIRIPKTELEPASNKILYGISTVTNYEIFDSPTRDVETNLFHFMEVMDSCHRKYGKDFTITLISTWFVFGGGSTKESPFTEESHCDPKGFYSITARCREQLLISYCETFKIKYKILRLANVLGAKDTKVSKKKNALQFLLDKIVHNEDIELYDGGNFYRDYIDVRDCARAIKIAMEKDTPIVNISNGDSVRFKDLIDFSVKYAKSQSNVWEKLDKPEFHAVVQSKDIFLSNQKLKEMGYSPEFTIWDTLENIIDDYQR